MYVAEDAVLTLGKYGTVGSDVKIICRESITIGEHVGVTWGV